MSAQLQPIEMILDKMNRLYRNFKQEDPLVARIELDLFKDYTRQLYAALLEYDQMQPNTTGIEEKKLDKQHISQDITSLKKPILPFYQTQKPLLHEKEDPQQKIIIEPQVHTKLVGIDPPLPQVLQSQIHEADPLPKLSVDTEKNDQLKQQKSVENRKPITNTTDDDESYSAAFLGKFGNEKPILADKIKVKTGPDLKNAFDLNDKFFFIKELFKNDTSQFDKAIRFINNLTTFNDAKIYVEKDIAVQFNWQMKDESVGRFLEIIKSKFIP